MLAAERGAAKNTTDAYRRDLEDFAGFQLAAGRSLTSTVARDIAGYLKHTSGMGLAAASRARRLSALRQFYRFLAADGIIETDPALGFAGPRKEQALPKTMSMAEVERLLDTARQRIALFSGRERFRALRLHALLEVLYATGMRVSELVFAVGLELPIMLALSWIVCRRLIACFDVAAILTPRLVMGGLAFGILMLAEMGVSTLLLGRSVSEHIEQYRELLTLLGLATQIAFAIFPALQLVNQRQSQ